MVELPFKVFGEQEVGVVSDDSGISRDFSHTPLQKFKCEDIFNPVSLKLSYKHSCICVHIHRRMLQQLCFYNSETFKIKLAHLYFNIMQPLQYVLIRSECTDKKKLQNTVKQKEYPTNRSSNKPPIIKLCVQLNIQVEKDWRGSFCNMGRK